MNEKNRDGGAAAAVAMIILLMIMIVAGGGAFFVFSVRRAASFAALERALAAEQQAVMMQKRLQESLAQADANSPTGAESPVAAEAPAAAAGHAETTPNLEGQPATGIDRLAWLAHDWQPIDGPTSTEEHWMAPRAGMMLGINRGLRDDGSASFEYLRIESTDKNQLVYYASPSGNPAVEFPLLELDEDRVVFENPTHDFPRRISYWLDDQRRLHARIEGAMGGQERSMEWTWFARR